MVKKLEKANIFLEKENMALNIENKSLKNTINKQACEIRRLIVEKKVLQEKLQVYEDPIEDSIGEDEGSCA